MASYNEYDIIQLKSPEDGVTAVMPCVTPKTVLFPDGTTLEENLKNSKADWNENDEYSPGYIKNRPFYYDDYEEILLWKEPIEINTSVASNITLPMEIVMLLKESLNQDGQFYINANINNELHNLHIINKYESDTILFGLYEFYDSKYDIVINYSINGNLSNLEIINIIEEETISISNCYLIKQNTKFLNKNFLLNNNSAYIENETCEAINIHAHAEGSKTKATKTCSHAEGTGTTASGSSAHAEGFDTVASGIYSHAEGYSTFASGNYQHVQGQYNIEDNSSAHIVGWGDNKTKKNIHTLSTQGVAWFSGDVYVGSTSGKNRDEGSEKLVKQSELPSADFNISINDNLIYSKTEDYSTEALPIGKWLDGNIIWKQTFVITENLAKDNTIKVCDIPTGMTVMAKGYGIVETTEGSFSNSDITVYATTNGIMCKQNFTSYPKTLYITIEYVVAD